MVQRRAARYVNNNYDSTASVTDMLESLKWRSLANRRADARLSLFYKITHNLVDVPSENFLTPVTRSSRLHHNFAFQVPQSNTDYHLNSFFPQTIRTWNKLPSDVVESNTLNTFKNKIQTINHLNPNPR